MTDANYVLWVRIRVKYSEIFCVMERGASPSTALQELALGCLSDCDIHVRLTLTFFASPSRTLLFHFHAARY